MRPYHEQEAESRLTQAARTAAAEGAVYVRTEDEAWALARAEADRALAVFNQALHPVRLHLRGPGGIHAPLFVATKLWLFPGIEPDPGDYSFDSIMWRDRQWTTSDTQRWSTFEAYLLDLAAKPGFARVVGQARRLHDNAPTTQVRKSRWTQWLLVGFAAAALSLAIVLANCG